METRTKWVGDEQLECYCCTSIADLEYGTFFGIMASKRSFATVIPDIVTPTSGDSKFELQANFHINDEVFGEHFGDAEIPLIFEKLDGQYAEELLTGKKYRIYAGWCDNFDQNSTKEEISEMLDELSVRNIRVTCNDNSKDQELTCAVFVVNDKFKLKYGETTLPRRAEVADALRQIDQRAAKAFKEGLEEYLGKMRAMAETEYEMYKNKKHVNTVNRRVSGIIR